MRIVVFGAQGQVGQGLLAAPFPAACEIMGFGRNDADVTDHAAINSMIRTIKPDLVINASAYNAVDAAELDRDAAFAVNSDAVENIAQSCSDLGAALVHISSDYIFDGTKSAPYHEADEANPLGVYGESKWAGEQAVRKNLDRHIILRTSWVFSRHRQNFVKTIFKLLALNRPLKVIDDQTGCPTPASDIAHAIVRMSQKLDNDASFGTYHLSGSGPVTWYGFACKIAEEAGFADADITPVTTEQYGQQAKRPSYSVLDCSKFTQQFDAQPAPWAPALTLVTDYLQKENAK